MTQGSPPKPKVLYAFQGTGNGHASRAEEILKHLKQWARVEVLCSGRERQLKLAHKIDFHFNGISFKYNAQGGLDYLKTLTGSRLDRFWQEVRSLDLSGYDLVINDFEPVSAWAAKQQGITCIGFGHQAAFLSLEVPRPPRKNRMAEWIFRNYAPSDEQIGLHFKSYGEAIYRPILRKEILDLSPESGEHYMCYLPAYGDQEIYEVLAKLSNHKWLIYSKSSDTEYQKRNCTFKPISGPSFMIDLASAAGVLCSAGFETPAEALYLKKKLMVIPIKGQYEQACNAAALKGLGVPVLAKLGLKQLPLLQDWVYSNQEIDIEVIKDIGFFLRKELIAKMDLRTIPR